MEFLEVPLFDDDLYKMLVRLGINLLVVTLVVVLCYRRTVNSSRSFIFTFVLMNVMVFFVCFTLKKLELGLGMALGLFAIFAIIRYRTDTIRVKEVTYLFIVIGIAVINALSNKKTSYAELMFTNGAIITVTFFLEQVLTVAKFSKQDLIYDKLALLNPDKRSELIADIEARIGIRAEKIKVSKIDLMKGTASLTVSYRE
ncbi:MAG: DUF4956 domain-containing protein [Planctomycetota bacterium]